METQKLIVEFLPAALILDPKAKLFGDYIVLENKGNHVEMYIDVPTNTVGVYNRTTDELLDLISSPDELLNALTTI